MVYFAFWMIKIARMVSIVLAYLILKVNAGDGGEYTIGGLHDLDKGWMKEVLEPHTQLNSLLQNLISNNQNIEYFMTLTRAG